jgi:GNAT superfamily N-acetyltransferase
MTALSEAVTRSVATHDAAPFTLHVAGLADVPAILGLFDEAVVWLNERGNTQQWGTTAFSTSPKRVAAATVWVGTGGAVVATREDAVCGALVVGEATPYASPATEPELYVVGLVGGRGDAARGAGRALLGLADTAARELGVARLRVDCYAGGDQDLVRFYESAGYTRTETFDVDGWPGQVLERRLG